MLQFVTTTKATCRLVLVGTAALLAVAQTARPDMSLAGCMKPKETAAMMADLALSEKDWTALTMEHIRSAWPVPLNQVGCSGTQLLSYFGRVINDDALCSTSFVFHAASEREAAKLVEVNVHYSSRSYEEARSAAELFHSSWQPSKGTKTEDFGIEDWRTKAQDKESRHRTVTEWEVSRGACRGNMKLERTVYPSKLEPAWTAKVALSLGHIDCGPE
jgi:hypothetical protein